MAYRSPNSSPTGSHSSAASSNVSPASYTTSLGPSTMVPTPEDSDSPSRSGRGTPSRHQIDIPRVPSASKGGCWTCRLRRKKCDEQREGDSCRTCKRLTINCLGWGPKRPEWMRDKQSVEAYKANIKAQLTRAGLIRGQPRSSLMGATATPLLSSQVSQQTYLQPSPSDISPSSALHFDHPDYYRYFDAPQDQHRHNNNVMPGMPGASNSGFHHISDSLFPDPAMNALELHPPLYQHPQSVAPLLTPLVDFSPLVEPQDLGGFGFDVRPPSPPPSISLIPGQNNVQGDHVIYYFEHVRKVQNLFAGNTFTNATYSCIAQEPRGAVSNAVCALASLHFTRMRVAQGLEAPDPHPEHSNATYFHNEAFFQLDTAKQMRGRYSESDAIAALHLVSFTQLAGGTKDWQPAFSIVAEWLSQTGLPASDDPATNLRAMNPVAQLVVRGTLWLDAFSCITLARPPRFLKLLKRLFGEREGYWSHINDSNVTHSLRMDLLTGCPDEAILAIAEITTLCHWKTAEQRRGTLSVRELIRRGDDIEQRLRKNQVDLPCDGNLDQTPLDPNLVQQTSAVMEPGTAPFPSDSVLQKVCSIFRESAALYLHTVLNNAIPGVAEISDSVDTIIRLLGQLSSSEMDHALVFPICLAGSMTNNAAHRDFCKGRLSLLDRGVGNVMQVRLAIEAIWQKRDINGSAVDLRDIVQERGLHLLLV